MFSIKGSHRGKQSKKSIWVKAGGAPSRDGSMNVYLDVPLDGKLHVQGPMAAAVERAGDGGNNNSNTGVARGR